MPAPKKKIPVTKADYIDRFIERMKRLDRKTFNYDTAEEWAQNAWNQHKNENHRHMEDKSPEKDAECELMWQVSPPSQT